MHIEITAIKNVQSSMVLTYKIVYKLTTNDVEYEGSVYLNVLNATDVRIAIINDVNEQIRKTEIEQSLVAAMNRDINKGMA